MAEVAWLPAAFALAFGTAALVDWSAVHTERKSVEHFAKPATLGFLICAALTLDAFDDHTRALVVAGLAMGLIGDVLLMIDKFVPGALAFLCGHVLYIVAFAGANPDLRVAGLVLLACVPFIALIGARIAKGASARARVLGPVVIVYQVVLSLMCALAVSTGNLWAGAGAVLFVISDTLLGWNRFVKPVPHGRVLVHTTYHLAQGLIALSLLSLG